MKPSFSIATNAGIADDVRIRHSIPSWLRVFGDQLSEILIVLDPQPPSGRIAALHGTCPVPEVLIREIEILKILDKRIRVITLPTKIKIKDLLKKWFGNDLPIRCQAGTPIAAFIYAIDQARGEIVMRCDCDMLFYEAGWLKMAEELLEKGRFDVIEPPRLGLESGTPKTPVSTRAFLLWPATFVKCCLPMKAHRVDFLRNIHRYLQGRPPWLALEQMFAIEKMRGHLRHTILSNQLGFSLHAGKRTDVMQPGFENIVSHVERGNIPESQRLAGMDFDPAAWPSAF
jgi:hypothetical protein